MPISIRTLLSDTSQNINFEDLDNYTQTVTKRLEDNSHTMTTAMDAIQSNTTVINELKAAESILEKEATSSLQSLQFLEKNGGQATASAIQDIKESLKIIKALEEKLPTAIKKFSELSTHLTIKLTNLKIQNLLSLLKDKQIEQQLNNKTSDDKALDLLTQLANHWNVLLPEYFDRNTSETQAPTVSLDSSNESKTSTDVTKPADSNAPQIKSSTVFFATPLPKREPDETKSTYTAALLSTAVEKDVITFFKREFFRCSAPPSFMTEIINSMMKKGYTKEESTLCVSPTTTTLKEALRRQEWISTVLGKNWYTLINFNEGDTKISEWFTNQRKNLAAVDNQFNDNSFSFNSFYSAIRRSANITEPNSNLKTGQGS